LTRGTLVAGGEQFLICFHGMVKSFQLGLGLGHEDAALEPQTGHVAGDFGGELDYKGVFPVLHEQVGYFIKRLIIEGRFDMKAVDVMVHWRGIDGQPLNGVAGKAAVGEVENGVLVLLFVPVGLAQKKVIMVGLFFVLQFGDYGIAVGVETESGLVAARGGIVGAGDAEQGHQGRSRSFHGVPLFHFKIDGVFGNLFQPGLEPDAVEERELVAGPVVVVVMDDAVVVFFFRRDFADFLIKLVKG
jgi:hypothetical protein